MPFELKNVGATYQRMATTLLYDMIHKEIEVYVDDMMVKSLIGEDHFKALDKFLKRAEKYNLQLNPKKCVLGVTESKLLGHVISQKWIEVDPNKIKAIQEMPALKTEKEIRGFLGKIQYVNRFISRLTMICDPIFKLLRKDQPKGWNASCQEAFEKIKQYLSNSPVIQPSKTGKPLILYMVLEE